jgi:CheY-like chemotaxis protein
MNKILVIDDEEEIRELLKKRLEHNNYRVFCASNCQEALNISLASKPDLIILDIIMPGMDGYQTSNELKQNPATRDIPILFLTGKDLQPEGIIELYNKFGARDYIPKPSSFEQILDKVKRIIG